MSENAKIELPNGLELQGTYEKVESALKKLGYGFLIKTLQRNPLEWHYSESKQEWIAIEEMPARYIANVIKKMIKDAFPVQPEELKRFIADKVFAVIDSPDFHGLFEAYLEQKDEGNLDD